MYQFGLYLMCSDNIATICEIEIENQYMKVMYARPFDSMQTFEI